MRFTTALALLASSVLAVPSQTVKDMNKRDVIVKRADMSETCSVGYCTQNGGTTGGSGGSTTTVSSFAAFTEAAASDDAKIIYIEGTITAAARVDIASDKTIVGAFGSLLDGIGLRIQGVSNVILRNVRITKVLADYGDAVHIQDATNIWVDHCDLSSDMDNGKDYYDGLLDITHAGDYISVTNTFFHDHYKASLIGHSDNNGDEDTGHLRVTYANNYWYNINSRGPSIRFGTLHVAEQSPDYVCMRVRECSFNSYYLACSGAINTRMGAQALVQSTVFDECGGTVIESSSSDDDGYAVVIDCDLGDSENEAPAGSLTAGSMPYSYSLLGSGSTEAAVYGTAGQTLTF
ncbi:hypothetical protein MKZ38_006427 [Zalerion maritima]|uniref:pectate lyase n=1 Tax=Zalerion maritima TaxID=339359 RepID=A0AAD5RJ43_9PEZI|nr:hypothetical protein MKZ38_006427 [Zalerion maritima]